MFNVVSGFLTNLRVMVPILGLLAIGWGATYMFQSWKIGSLERQVVRHVADIAQLKANQIALRGTIIEQNASIEELNRKSAEKRAIGEAALRSATEADKILEDKASKLRGKPLPDDLEAVDELILEYYNDTL